jgi:hypothetical protein
MIAEETVEQAKVVSGSSKTVETEQPMVQLTTSTPENNQSPATESNLLESVPIIGCGYCNDAYHWRPGW